MQENNNIGPIFCPYVEIKSSGRFDGKSFQYLEHAEFSLAQLISQNGDCIDWGVSEVVYDEEVEHITTVQYVDYLQEIINENISNGHHEE